MNKNLLIFGLVMVCLAYAVNAVCSTDVSDYILQDGITNISINGSTVTPSQGIVLGGWTDAGSVYSYVADTTAVYDLTINYSGGGDNNVYTSIFTVLSEGCAEINLKDPPLAASASYGYIYVEDASDNIVARMGINNDPDDNYTYYAAYSGGTGSGNTKAWENNYVTLKMCWNNSYAYFYIDDVYIANLQSYSSGNQIKLLSGGSLGVSWDELKIWNKSAGSGDGHTCPAVAADTTPPVISNYNVTTDGGNISWRTDPTISVPTTDGTPTVTIDTDEAASCSMRNVNHTYSASYACSTTGSTSHICTLFDANKLVYGVQNVYIGCNDSIPNAGYSPALSINMTAGAAAALRGFATSYLEVSSYNNTHIVYNLTVEAFNPNTAPYSSITITPSANFGAAKTISLLANSSNRTSFTNTSVRGLTSDVVFNVAGIAITGNIVMTTNPIKSLNPIDPPHAFVKDGMAECSYNTIVSERTDLGYTLNLLGSGSFNVENELYADKIVKENDCELRIKSKIQNMADSFVYNGVGAKDTNYGTSTSMQVRRLNSASSPLTARTYLKFNNPFLSTQTITSATLKLYRNASDNIPAGANYSVYHVNGSGSWSELGITWNNQPCGTDFSVSAKCNLTALNKTSIVNTAGIWDYYDVTGAFQKIVSESKDNVSFVIRDDSESALGTDVMTIYASKETLDISRRPILIVDGFSGDGKIILG